MIVLLPAPAGPSIAMIGFLLVILKGIPGEAYNIGNPKPEISMIDLIGIIERVLKHPVKFRHGEQER